MRAPTPPSPNLLSGWTPPHTMNHVVMYHNRAMDIASPSTESKRFFLQAIEQASRTIRNTAKLHGCRDFFESHP